MQLDVQHVSRQPGASKTFELSAPWSEVSSGDEDVVFTGDVTAVGKATYAGDGIFEVIAHLKGNMETECARCLKAVRVEVETDVRERFSRGSDDDGEFYAYANDALVLDSYVRDGLLLAAPNRALCKEDCKGLCPRCGQDLNLNPHRTCDSEDITSNPFSKLAALIDDDDEEV